MESVDLPPRPDISMLYEHRSKLVYKGTLAAIVDFRCWNVETGRLLPEEAMSAPVVLFPRRGIFHRHGAGDPVLGDPNHVLFFNRGEPFRISYPKPEGDDSTLFVIDMELLAEILAVHSCGANGKEPHFPVSHALSGPDLFLVHGMLLDQASAPRPVDALRVEESIVRLAARAIAAAAQGGNGNGTAASHGRASTDRAHRECAERVKELLSRRFHEPLSLAEIARAAYVSPYHLCRVFSREVGMPVHRYLNRLRLRASLPRMTDRQANLSELALDLGYSSHSHFSSAFRREFGITPSEFRRTAKSSAHKSLEQRVALGT